MVDEKTTTPPVIPSKVEPQGSTTPPTTQSTKQSLPSENIETSKGPTVAERVAQIEKRWGKKFEEILIEMHDHLFGKTS